MFPQVASFILIVICFVGCKAGSFKLIEKSLISIRDDFSQSLRADVDAEHEVVFAIEQNNLDKLESLFFEVILINFIIHFYHYPYPFCHEGF